MTSHRGSYFPMTSGRFSPLSSRASRDVSSGGIMSSPSWLRLSAYFTDVVVEWMQIGPKKWHDSSRCTPLTGVEGDIGSWQQIMNTRSRRVTLRV